MNQRLSLIFSILFLAGILVPAYAQTSTGSVVINEIDTNPSGNDATSVSEWVELYNPTDSDVDLSGWNIASTTVLKKTMTIPSGITIHPGQFLTYSYQNLWFTDTGELVELRDANGVVVDKTPVISDIHNDLKSWQRIYDGSDLDSPVDWKFATSTVGSSNGKLVVAQNSNKVTVTVSSDKSVYQFGEAAVITGNVSEQVFMVKPFFQPESILVNISGPNYDKFVTLYPDLKLNYKTTLSLHQVLGINEGTYTVSVSYAGSNATTNFSVGHELIEQQQKVDGSFSVLSDKSQYIPGQFVSITGFASKIIPLEGMKLTVIDPLGKVISDGYLYPTKGKFTTSVFITTVNPVYGTYEVHAEYFNKSALSTFDVVKDIKEQVPISLWTDKAAYGLGEQVKITGRINQVWISTLDLEIVQTKQSSISSSLSGSDSGFKILDSVRIMGDGSFTYTFTIPNNTLRLGDYKINVAKAIGSATTIIHAVPNPDEFVSSNEPLTIRSDKETYAIGDNILLNGFIKDPLSLSYGVVSPVKISIFHEDGSPLEIVALPSGAKTLTSDGLVVAYDFTAIPETSGRYSLQIPVTQIVFTEGNYVVKSKYAAHTATTTFSIVDPLKLQDGAMISLDKEVYGLGGTIHLTGIFPPNNDGIVDITLTKPGGTKVLSSATIGNQKFSWSWTVPIADKVQDVKIDDGSDVTKSNLGIYKIRIATDSYSTDLFFKVSADPKNDSLSQTLLFVTTEKSLYRAGEKLTVLGNVVNRVQQENEYLLVPQRVTIQVLDGVFPYKQIYESYVYPNQDGTFSGIFELPVGVFSEGPYTVKALYGKTKTQTTFSVANNFVFDVDGPVSLLLSMDKSEYYPGNVVVVSGKPNQLIYIDTFDVSVTKKPASQITCGSFHCGIHVGPVTSISPSSSGSFSYQYAIPDSASAIGSYEIIVDTDFETKSLKFSVVEKPQTPKPSVVIEKESRLSGKIIPVFIGEKTVDSVTVAPRVFSGSLLTPYRSDDPIVNLKVSTADGVCVVGPDDGCLVRDSTRESGQIYDVVEVDGVSLNVRYSGPDVRLEKFSIMPYSSAAFLSNENWNIEVLKDDHASRFYYKVTYKPIE